MKQSVFYSYVYFKFTYLAKSYLPVFSPVHQWKFFYLIVHTNNAPLIPDTYLVRYEVERNKPSTSSLDL